MGITATIKKWIPNPVKHRLKPFFAGGKKGRIVLGKRLVLSDTAKLERRGGGNIRIGDDCEILDGVLLLTYGGDITVGHRCSINPYTIIYGHGNTTIGNDVLIAGHCMIIPNNHRFDSREKPIRIQGSTSRGIVIEDDVWLGHSCSILDGVHIGKGAVVVAGSVVNTDVAPYTVVGGVPAREIKKRP